MTDEQIERLTRAVVQSTMWRHYGHGTVVQYKRYANATDYGTYDDRLIDGDLFVPGDLPNHRFLPWLMERLAEPAWRGRIAAAVADADADAAERAGEALAEG